MPPKYKISPLIYDKLQTELKNPSKNRRRFTQRYNMQILSKRVYIWLSAQGPVWLIADNICFDCKVNGGWPRPLLTYYEVNKILLLLLLLLHDENYIFFEENMCPLQFCRWSVTNFVQTIGGNSKIRPKKVNASREIITLMHINTHCLAYLFV